MGRVALHDAVAPIEPLPAPWSPDRCGHAVPEGAPTRHWITGLRWTDRHRRLAAHPLLATCSREEVRTLVRYGDEVEVAAGTLLLREDTIGRCFVLVLQGQLRLSRHGRAVGTMGQGAWVGDVAILGFGPQPASVTTASRCRLFVLGSRPLLSVALEAPGVREGLFPGLTPVEALEQVRHLRLEGRERWECLRPAPRPVGATRPARLTRPKHGSSPSLAVTTRPFLPLSDVVVASEPAEPTRPRRRPATRWFTAVVVGGAIVTAAALARLPYYSVDGRIRFANELITVDGASSYPPSGELVLPIIAVRHDTGLTALTGWLDADTDVRTRRELFGDRDPEVMAHANRDLMATSKHIARAVALRTVGGLRGGDVIVDTERLGGPSGGLGIALAIVDVLTPGELTGGRRVAVTGTLASDGSVGPVGGIGYKTLAANHADVDLFIVPTANYAQAVAAAGDLRVIAVSSFDDAIEVLARLGGDTFEPRRL